MSNLIGRDEEGRWWIHVWLVGPLVVVFALAVLGLVALIEAAS